MISSWNCSSSPKITSKISRMPVQNFEIDLAVIPPSKFCIWNRIKSVSYRMIADTAASVSDRLSVDGAHRNCFTFIANDNMQICSGRYA